MNAHAHTRYYRVRSYGLGQATQAEQLGVSAGTTVGSAAATAALSSTLLPAGGAAGTFLGMGAAVAIPVVGAAIAAIGIGIMAILNSGCGQTCIETSQWANQAEPLLQQNVEAYFAIQAPRPLSVQTAAVQNFMNVWNRLVALCSQPGLGAAGKNCISDRQSGACKWKASATGAYPGQPAQGQCWNWWNAYHDPIAQDTQVYNDSLTTSAAAVVSGTTGATGATGVATGATGASGSAVISSGSGSDLLVIGGVIVAALFVVSQL